LLVVGIVDVLLLGLILHQTFYGGKCAENLKMSIWLGCAVLGGAPLVILTDNAIQKGAERKTFYVEYLLGLLCFAWLGVGTFLFAVQSMSCGDLNMPMFYATIAMLISTGLIFLFVVISKVFCLKTSSYCEHKRPEQLV